MNLKKYEYEVKKKFVTNTLKKFGVVSCELLPINLNGVFNKCVYLLKDVPIQDIKDYAKQERMIAINYLPRVKYTKSGINSKMDWHINLILVSTIVNFCNTQDILMHFKPDYPIAELTNEDVKTNLVYWTSKLNEHATKYINDYFNHFNVANPEELLHDKIKQYSRYYKDLDEITRLIDLYSPMVNCQVHACNKLNQVNYGNEDKVFKKSVNIRVYGCERNETIKSVRTLDGSKCLYLPLDIKMQLFSWYNKDSKSCRKYIRTIAKDIFPHKKNDTCSIFNLFTIMGVFNKRNPDRILNLDDNQIEILKDDLKTIFSYYKDSYEYAPVIKNNAMENVSIREDVVVKEEEIDDQNVSKDEGDMFKFETEEDECVPNGYKLSDEEFFKRLTESV